MRSSRVISRPTKLLYHFQVVAGQRGLSRIGVCPEDESKLLGVSVRTKFDFHPLLSVNSPYFMAILVAIVEHIPTAIAAFVPPLRGIKERKPANAFNGSIDLIVPCPGDTPCVHLT
jgi:hypothetical protein